MGASILMKFGSVIQNNMHITENWSRSKPEVEIQHGGCLYFETGSSYISAANWDIWTKFGLLNFAQIGAPTAELWRHIHFWIWRPRPLNTTSGFVFVDVTAFRKSISKPNFQMIKNNMQITANWSRSKPEVEFQYGGRLYIKNESNYISAANWDISTKFCLLIDFDVLKAVTSTNTKPEVVFSGRGRHLEKWIWRHISAADVPIWTKFGRLMQNNMQITGKWSRSKPEVEFQHGGRLYFKIGNSYISAANGDISTKFGLLIDFDILKTVTSTNTKPELLFSGRGSHLENWKWRYISAYFGVEQLYTGNLLTVVLAHYTHS